MTHSTQRAALVAVTGMQRRLRWAILIGVTVVGCPRILARGVWTIETPLQNLGAAIIVSAAGLAWWSHRRVSHREVLPWPARVLVVVIIYAMAVGLLHSGRPTFLWHLFVRESIWLAMCFAGVLVARTMPGSGPVTLIVDMCSTAAVLLLGFSIALRLDLLGPPDEATGRRLDLALYALSTVVLTTMPVIARMAKRERRGRGGILALASLSVLAFGVVSGTRSVLAVWLFGSVLSGYFLLRAAAIPVWKVLGFTLACASAGALLLSVGGLHVVTERLRDSEALVENIRFTEVREFLELSQEWFPFGAGIGVGFRTVVGLEAGDDVYDGLVNVSHIGIMAWSIKAGLLGIFFSSALIVAATRAVATSKRRLSRTIDCYPGVAVLLVIGCTSGGWTMMDLFLTGLFVAVGNRIAPATESTASKIRPEWNRTRRLRAGVMARETFR